MTVTSAADLLFLGPLETPRKAVNEKTKQNQTKSGRH